MKKTFQKYFTDSLLIVFSVLFALFINKLYDDYQTGKKKEIAMESIAKELYRNKGVMKDWKERHTQIMEKLNQLISGEEDSLKSELKSQAFFQLGLVTEDRALIDDVVTSTA